MMQSVLCDRYQLLELLGRKAGRRTWLALDMVTQQRVVIKLLLFGADFEWDALKLFEREAKTLQDLDHPAIPKYLDWFEVDEAGRSGFALVQTYIEAPSLEQIVQSGRTFSAEELRNIAEQILAILDYLHQRHPMVIHRDLKPSNILLGDRAGNSPGKVSLVDFGSVQNLAVSKGGTITIVGTYGYMPMEQFGDRAVPASDLYSLGATMLYLATGKDPADLLSDDLQMRVDSIPGLNSHLTAWIRQLMQTNLKDRPASVQAAIALLNQPEIAISPSERTLAQPTKRFPYPGGCRFYRYDMTDERLTLSFADCQLNIKYLQVQPRSQGCLSIMVGVCIAFVGVFAIISLLIVGSGLVFISIILALGFLIWNIIPYFREYHRVLQINRSEIKLSCRFNWNSDRVRSHRQDTNELFDHLQSTWGKSAVQSFPKHQVWQLECAHNGYHLNLKVANQIWQIRGNPEEIDWLAGEISHYLQIPVTFYTAPLYLR